MLPEIKLSQLMAGVLGGAALAVTQLAKAVAVASVTITGGTFSVGTPIDLATCDSAFSPTFGTCKHVSVGPNNVLVAGQIGEPITNTAPIPAEDRTVSFLLFNRLWTERLAASAVGAGNARDWDNGFSGEIDGDTITLNMGGWFGNWVGTSFFEGTDSSGAPFTSTAATGTIDAEGNFQVDWTSAAIGGPIDGQTIFWRLTGVAQPVPEPETWGMLLAGLGLIGVAAARRRSLKT